MPLVTEEMRENEVKFGLEDVEETLSDLLGALRLVCL